MRFSHLGNISTAHFEERIIQTPERTYYATENLEKDIEESVRKLVIELFANQQIKSVLVQQQRLIIRHCGAKPASIEARILKALRDSGYNPEVPR